MSRRTAEASKAIREAWEKEYQYVLEGKGTRNWTPEQQQSIIDKGKAYDDQGRAFEGQHMKSVAEYPEYQGNPDNIQFLTKDEHLEAHKGNWQNPTNWYYDPVTKEFLDFGDGDIIPCKVIDLFDPISKPTVVDTQVAQSNKKDSAKNEIHAAPSGNDETKPPHKDTAGVSTSAKRISMAPIPQQQAPKSDGGFLRGLKKIGRFIVDHPVESIEIAGVLFGGAKKLVSSLGSGRGKNSSATRPNTSTRSQTPTQNDITTQIAEIVERANRASPHDNDVSGHRQRYHTKDGVIWKDKGPYHRGGKDG